MRIVVSTTPSFMSLILDDDSVTLCSALRSFGHRLNGGNQDHLV